MPTKESERAWTERLHYEQILWQYGGSGPHAAFSIGNRHSASYFNSDILFQKPLLLREISRWFFERLAQCQIHVEAVVAKAPFSSRLAEPLAGLLEVPLIRFGDDSLRQTRTALVFADDIYSGSLIGEIISTLAGSGVSVASPICVIANYSGSDAYRDYPLLSHTKTRELSPAWEPNDCPLCKEGSRVIPARTNWYDLVGPKRFSGS